MGNSAGRRNTKIKGGGRRSKGIHTGPPSQGSAGNKRRVRAEKRELLKRLALATKKSDIKPGDDAKPSF